MDAHRLTDVGSRGEQAPSTHESADSHGPTVTACSYRPAKGPAAARGGREVHVCLKEGMAKAEIVTVLQRYAYDINRISALMPDSGTAKDAQSKLKQLKDAIHSDYKQRHAIARTAQLTPLEQSNLARAIPRCVLRPSGNRRQYDTRAGSGATHCTVPICIYSATWTELREPETSVESDTTEWL